MRLSSFILLNLSVLLTIYVSVLSWFNDKPVIDLIYLIIVLLGYSVGGKVTQKFGEKETTTEVNKTE